MGIISRGRDMMFFLCKKIQEEFDALPDNIKRIIAREGGQINSAEELRELVRRIRNAQTGKLN